MPFIGVLYVGAIIGAAAATSAGPPVTQAQSAVQQNRPQQAAEKSEKVITFFIRSAPAKPGGNSNDLITIQFSSSSAAVRQAPQPLFDRDVVAEFSFSAIDAQGRDPFKFQRLISDTTFLNSRFIRVINHGNDGWAGDSIAITMTDLVTRGLTRILDQQSMYPRRGYSRDGGIQSFNSLNWAQRTYWEADFQRIKVR
jgi:hypothetical protein